MTKREQDEGGLSAPGVRLIGFDQVCQCGHEEGCHNGQPADGTECCVIECECTAFTAAPKPGIPAYQETARKRVYHELARRRRAPLSADWLEHLCAYLERGGKITPAQGLDLLCELIRLQFDIACRDGGMGSLYGIREALGFNDLYPLDRLDSDAKAMRTALLACAPIAHAAIAQEKKDEVGNSDLDNEQPIALTVRTTLGAIREARRALFVANIQGGES